MAGPLRALTLLAVVACTVAGGYLALTAFSQQRDLSVGRIQLSIDPGHKGALDLYVPLVDWGARFEAIRLPVRLRVDLRTVDREQAERIATGAPLDVDAVRIEARNAIAAYLRALVAIVCAAALALGTLAALAVRNRSGPKLRYTAGAAALTTAAIGVALIVLLPPRGEISKPQYYAYGADIPRALDAAARVQRSTQALDQELDAQLVGLARLVTEPANRRPLADRPQITIASDLHNNVLALPILERVADDGPIFFPGDLSDRGSPIETALLRRVARIGRPFVFVTGNHDSDASAQTLADDGAIVLTQFGRLEKRGGLGPVVVTVNGIRVAGYGDPFMRRASDQFADRFDPVPSPALQQAFTDWLTPLLGQVDIVMVHQPALIEQALATLEPTAPLVFVVGHTHATSLTRRGAISVVNGGSLGAGGTGNLADAPTRLGLARLFYDTEGAFAPLAVDLVEIDPGSGAATARRERLD